MQHFEFRIQGLRPWPIVMFVTTDDTQSALAMAERIHSGRRAQVDVWQAKRYLFTVGRPALMRDDHVIPSGFAADYSV